ncbi:RNA polymerase sigma-70 factor (ECF subfamily) [Nocardioides ginsengisegetis]|uniref:RNA polymerase sigma-70 factor (ECF subfamily) n=1 Tax=Nocardioides ginsengisegetis TaxID=661491 RepID=A0A7W3J179_9ACTN|nr:sigma-70 family RNA polymerase sigma factor [Nocardioides ginsengisegetis]MBA8804335.1 RNA polymerase sigma-70 factor (ECF subfamily) [Nocardioides ginsengisegetis]
MGDAATTSLRADTVSVGRVESVGADEEFRALFTVSFAAVARTVHLIVGDGAVAEEITQDAFVKLLGHWRTVSRYERPDLWVRRVAIRAAQRERHRTWRRDQLERSVAPRSWIEDPDGPDDQVRAAVETLAPKQRAVVVLFYFEDRPMAEIADLVGCSVSAGWSQLHTARKRLARLLAEEVHDDVR